MVQGLVDTGIPKCIWGALMPDHPLGKDFISEGHIDYGQTIIFILAVLTLSNLLSNVPLILLMRPMLNDLDDREAKAVWLVVAFVCESRSRCKPLPLLLYRPLPLLPCASLLLLPYEGLHAAVSARLHPERIQRDGRKCAESDRARTRGDAQQHLDSSSRQRSAAPWCSWFAKESAFAPGARSTTTAQSDQNVTDVWIIR